MATATTADLYDLRNFLIAHLDKNFALAHDQLDQMNGRLGKLEVSVGQHDVRLEDLEAPPPSPPPAVESGEDRRVTDRDVRIVIGTCSVAAAGGLFVWRVVPILAKVFGVVAKP